MYSLEFKLKALQLVERVGITAAAEMLAISSGRLYDWKRNKAYIMSLYEQEQKNLDEAAVLLEELKALRQKR